MLLDRFKRTIDRYDLLSQGDRLVVGVSGGVDSMVLLHLLNSCRVTFDLSLIVAHVNHGLRPQEAEEEAHLVRKECERLDLPFEFGTFDAREFQRVGKFSLQEAARRLRFYFFEQVLRKHGAEKIALGHHADDQIETFLLRLMRGTGLQGLKGMLPIREGKVIRPLLEVWRDEIEEFAVKNRIPFLTDSSNLKRDYLRNRLRLSLIPLLEKEYQPKFKEILLRTAAILREENDYLEREAEKAYQSLVNEREGIFSFRYDAYRSLHSSMQRRVLKKVLRRLYGEEGEGSETTRLFEKLRQAPPSFLLEFPSGISIEKRYELISFARKKVETIPPFEVELLSPGRTFVKEIAREVVAEEIRVESSCERPWRSSEAAFMDQELLQFPLRIRNFRPGDRFHPLGARGSQKLKEFFIDHKIPRFERPKVPLIISGSEIVCVLGHRISESVRVTDRTRRILKVSLM